MLVLTRKQQEKICIGNGITITVLKMKGKTVRLGIDAPAEVKVIRGELRFDDKPSDESKASPVENTASAPLPPSQTRVRESNWVNDASAVLSRVSRSESEKLRGPLRAMLERQRASAG